jgi:hypothetical protein
MNRRAIRVFPLLGLIVVLGLGRMMPAQAQASTRTTTFKGPLTLFIFVTCGGILEDLQLSGQIEDVIHQTVDAQGVTHLDFEAGFQVAGIGPRSGLLYEGSGAFNDRFTFSGTGPSVFTFVESFVLHRQGTIGNLTIRDTLVLHSTFRAIVDANGNATIIVDNSHVECVN